jgi:holin-like protein
MHPERARPQAVLGASTDPGGPASAPELPAATGGGSMFRSITLLVCANALGEALRHGFRLPVSGPVLGMMLLFLFFVARGGVPVGMELTTRPLLRHLPLFFVPAGVGIVTQFGVIGREWPVMTLALAVSTVVGLLASVAALGALDRVTTASRERHGKSRVLPQTMDGPTLRSGRRA